MMSVIYLIFVLISPLLYLIIKNNLVVLKFRLKTPRMPIAPDRSIIDNHLSHLACKKNNIQIFHENHAKLGQTFAFFIDYRPAVSTVDLDFIKRIMIEEGNIDRPLVESPMHEIDVDCILQANVNQWKRIRRAFGPAFSPLKIKSANVQAELELVQGRFIDGLDWRLRASKAPVELDLDDLCTRWAVDVVFTLLFKQPHTINYRTRSDEWVEGVDLTSRDLVNPIIRTVFSFRILHKPADWLIMNFLPSGEFRSRIASFVTQQTELNFKAREEASRENAAFEELESYKLSDGRRFARNISDYIADRLYDGSLTKREHLHSSVFLFIAAVKTTADALVAIMFLLAKHPEVQEKLRASLAQEALGSVYLSWVINEALRLFPPVNSGCERVIAADVFTSDGLLVPKGTITYEPAHTVHRLKKYWGQDADEFRPERWAESKSFHPCQFIAFGLGRRNCIGGRLAQEALKMLLNELLSRYRFESSPKSSELNYEVAPFFVFTVVDKPTIVIMSALK